MIIIASETQRFWEIAQIGIPAIVSVAAIFLAASISRTEERTKRIEEMTLVNLSTYIGFLNSFLSDISNIENEMMNYVRYSSQIIKHGINQAAIVNDPIDKAFFIVKKVQNEISKLPVNESTEVYVGLCQQIYDRITNPELWKEVGSKYQTNSITCVMTINERFFNKDKKFIEEYSAMFEPEGASKNSVEDVRKLIILYNEEIISEFYSFKKNPSKWLKI